MKEKKYIQVWSSPISPALEEILNLNRKLTIMFIIIATIFINLFLWLSFYRR